MKIIALFLIWGSIAIGCDEPCQGKVDFKEIRTYLIRKMPIQFGVEESSLAFVGAYGVHEDKEELRGYGFFPKTKMAGIYRLDCNDQKNNSFHQVEMSPVLNEMTDSLSKKIREFFIWQNGYSEILELWVSKSPLDGLSDDYNHWLVLVNLPGDRRSDSSWWKFVELRSKKEILHLEAWAGAFAYPVIPGPPPIF